ncbi:MAG: APC family permease [Chloroflexi bacterium]|nr:APC family permease [Chloroflexota bacterium]
MTDPESSQNQPVAHTRGRVSRIRVELPHAGIVPGERRNRFEATAYAEERRGWRGRYLGARDSLLGDSMSNARLQEERLSKKVALAIFSSDALSSTAYATQEILLILVLAGAGAIRYSLPISAAIVLLLAIVVISYRQTIRAYPGGGGAYIVAHENLGVAPGLLAASSLLIDYVLTTAVSIAAAVEAIYSAFPAAHGYAVPIAVAMVVVIALGNLRGIRESGTIFSIPTYGFIVVLGGTLVVGMLKVFTSSEPNVFAVGQTTRTVEAEQTLTLFLILRAFSAGSTALTGVEAISNGVSAFKPPEWKNAASTMTSMALVLGALFLGTTLLARHYGIVYLHGDQKTVMSQIGEQVFGRNVFYYTLQFFTAAILFLAANTAYNGFPLLGAILARDGYLPRIFHQRGNRLVFSYGIIALTGFAILLLVVFNASTTRLIPLYALGVFLSFSLAQAGMVRRWRRIKDAGWRRSAIINGIGAVATAVVFVIILVTKFTQGGWMVVVLLPIMTLWLFRIGGFYKRLHRSLFVAPDAVLDLRPHGRSSAPIIVPVEEVNLATIMALSDACERSSDVTAVHVAFDVDSPQAVEQRWDQQFPAIPLVVIDSPYRTVADPIAVYINDRLRQPPHEVVLVIPVLEGQRWYQRPLVNQSLKRLTSRLQARRHVTVIPFPFHVGAPGRRQTGDSGLPR